MMQMIESILVAIAFFLVVYVLVSMALQAGA
jgi:hypothetical protein